MAKASFVRFHERCGHNNRRGLHWWCAVIFCLAISSRQTWAGEASPELTSKETKVWKVLMIGNSYTYCNNLWPSPRLVESGLRV